LKYASSETWRLQAGDFTREVVPANLIVMAALILVGTFHQQVISANAATWVIAGTAASAGIILAEESQRLNDPEHAITFQRYLAFGLSFSLFMLLFYAASITAVG
jgi:hypothetical protein